MKDFDRVQIGVVRRMEEANYWFKRNAGVACRQEIHSRYRERWKAWWNRIVMKEGRL